MKKLFLLFLGLLFTIMMQALTVVSTAGGLATAIADAGDNLTTVTNLTVTGTIDERDFETMGGNMPALQYIDLSGASVAEYTAYTASYPANTVPTSAFFLNMIISSVILPTSVISIGDNAFCYCGGLTSVIIPSSVISIGDNAFSDCNSLKSVTIPSSVISIGDYAFSDCNNLTSVTIPSSVISIGDNAFSHCDNLTSVTIPSSVTSIGDNAFNACRSLISVIIPSSVTSIGDNAFSDCNSLTSLYVWSVTPVSLETSFSVFFFVPTSTCVLHVPVGAAAAYRAAWQWSDFDNIVDDLEKESYKTDLDHATLKVMSLYPNPATNGFTVNAGEKTTVVSIYDENGSLVKTQQATGKTFINISSLQKGVYVVKANGWVGKLVKE